MRLAFDCLTFMAPLIVLHVSGPGLPVTLLRPIQLVVALVGLAALPLHFDEFVGIQLARISFAAKGAFRVPRNAGFTNPPEKWQLGGLP